MRYSRIAILLHWLIAGALAFQIGMGWRMEHLAPNQELYDAVQLHKSVGITILLLSLLRLAVRFFKPPPLAITDDKWALFLARLTHIALYAFMIGAPLTGWLVVSSSKLEIETMLFGVVPWPHIPGIETLAAGTKEAVHELSESAHELMAWTGISLFMLHVMGAIRHQFLKSEPLLDRILPVAGAQKRVFGTVIIIGLVALLGLTALVTRGIEEELEEPDQGSRLDAAQNPSPNAANNTPSERAAGTESAPEKDPAEEEETALKADQKPAAGEAESTPAAQAPVPGWTITRKSPIRFSVGWNGSPVQGSFSAWNAQIMFSPEALDRSTIRVTVDLSSARTGDASIDEALHGADFFATSSFPRATIASNRFRSLGGNRYEATGTMVLKNMSRPVKLAFTLDISGSTAKVTGTANISRSAHKVGVGDYSAVADNVAVSFNFSATH